MQKLSPNQALHDDVHMLASLLGEVLQEQGEQALFSQVERARLLAKAHRQGQAESLLELLQSLKGQPPKQAAELARAFSSFFSVVNMAERVHRIRQYREQISAAQNSAPGTLQASVQSLLKRGVDPQRIAQELDRLHIEPVFTAHPTELNRRSQLEQQQRLARLLVDRIEKTGMTPQEHEANHAALLEQISLMWLTAEEAEAGRSVSDEREHVLFYVLRVIYRIIPAYYERLRSAKKILLDVDEVMDSHATLRMASWVGGDMDGNPLVGAETIRDSLVQQRDLILDRYLDDLKALRRLLSQSKSRIALTDDLRQLLESMLTSMPKALAKIPLRHRDMPYRVFVRLLRERLLATRFAEGENPYLDGQNLLDDLKLLAHSLRQNKGEHAGLHQVEALIYRVQTFAFHLVSLDLRQDALEHRLAVAALLDDVDYPQKDAAERLVDIRHLLEQQTNKRFDGQNILQHPDAEQGQAAERAIAVMQAIKQGRSEYGPRAFGLFIISMAQGPDDALALLLLARFADLVDDTDHVPLDVTPLFETVDDLKNAEQTMDSLFADPLYMRHLRSRNMQQSVMLGYSDSSKGDGLAASRWGLFVAQERLVKVAERYAVNLHIFHGRGGTVSRGGSKPREAVLAEPPGAVNSKLRMTEQGEIIHAKYGLRGTALHSLELVSGAVLEASIDAHEPAPHAACPDHAREMMDLFAQKSRQAFRALVYGNPDFYPYFRNATPVDVIEMLRIGSRPASRRAGRGVHDLRAIPWVFSWVQSRHLLSAWYGLGLFKRKL